MMYFTFNESYCNVKLVKWMDKVTKIGIEQNMTVDQVMKFLLQAALPVDHADSVNLFKEFICQYGDGKIDDEEFDRMPNVNVGSDNITHAGVVNNLSDTNPTSVVETTNPGTEKRVHFVEIHHKIDEHVSSNNHPDNANNIQASNNNDNNNTVTVSKPVNDIASGTAVEVSGHDSHHHSNDEKNTSSIGEGTVNVKNNEHHHDGHPNT